ncbi:hypothetical protein DFH28DRAFT_444438 [Melampsora americana]|nr:hypothetical protein DFH28DRAFT_444438 [Melampsora americana]
MVSVCQQLLFCFLLVSLILTSIAYIITNYRQTAQSDVLFNFQSIITKSDRTTSTNDKDNQFFKTSKHNQHILSKRSFGYIPSEVKTLHNVLEPETKSAMNAQNFIQPGKGQSSISHSKISPQMRVEKVIGDTKVEKSRPELTPFEKSNRHLLDSDPKRTRSQSQRLINWIFPSRHTSYKKINKALANSDPKEVRSQSSKSTNSDNQLNIFRVPKLSNSKDESKPIHSESVKKVAQIVGAQTPTVGGSSSFRKSFTFPSTPSRSFRHSPGPSKNGKPVIIDRNRSVPPKNDFQTNSYLNREIAHMEGRPSRHRSSHSESEINFPNPFIKKSHRVGSKIGAPKNQYKIPGRPSLVVIDERQAT